MQVPPLKMELFDMALQGVLPGIDLFGSPFWAALLDISIICYIGTSE